ncbi:MAG: hypothetical protein IJJ69_06140 [Oscillospiraceae bacterium]|nr:hypothetical protein [Oscillospiraceae bacterium]
MKKKTKQTQKKKCNIFCVFGSLALCAGSFLLLPIILDKLTNIAYRIMYPVQDDE